MVQRTEISKEVYDIALPQIKVSDLNVRQHERDLDVGDLKESIRQLGLLQPVLLKGHFRGPDYKGKYELIVGQRRFEAHRQLGWRSIKAIFAGALTDTEAKVRSLAENMHRARLGFADISDAITVLYSKYNKDIGQVSKVLGVGEQTIRRYIDIKKVATPKVTKLLSDRKISMSDARRAIEAAEGDPQKTDYFAQALVRMPSNAKGRLKEVAEKKRHLSAKDIVAEAMKPVNQISIILDLTPEVEVALNVASRQLNIDRKELVEKALSEWLLENHYIK